MKTLFDRARTYLEAMPPGISGQDGHGCTFRAAVVLKHGFNLSDSDAWSLLQDFNSRCQPPWKDYELRHKLKSVESHKHPKAAGHLAGESWTGAGTVRVMGIPSLVPALCKPRPAPAAGPPRVFGVIRLSDTYTAPAPAVEIQKESQTPDIEIKSAPEPVTHCQTCRNRWGRHLLIDYCICTGDVRINSRWTA